MILWDYEDWSGARDWTNAQEHFLLTGPFLLWATLICSQTAAWAVAWRLLAKERKGLEPLWERRLVVPGLVLWLAAVGGAWAGAWGPAHAHWDSYEYLDHRVIKIGILGLIGATVAMYGVLGIWAVYRRLKQMFDDGGLGLKDVPRYLVLQAKLRLLLLIVGSLLGLTILTVGAERNAVTAWAEPSCPSTTPLQTFVLGPAHCDAHFPAEYMLIYGFFFTVLLAFAYFPAQLALLSVGRRIRDSVASLADLTPVNLVGRRAEREALDELLDLKTGTASSFRAALAVLTPLIGSLTGLLFGTGG